MAEKKSLDVYNNWKRISVVVNDLELDSQNVRLDLVTSERSKIDQGSIINDLFANENAFQILENVIENGWFIDETPIVIKNRNKYIVLEGNRRIAALKVLQNPLLAPSCYAKVKPLSSSVIPIKQIDVLLAPNRDGVSSLLANRHTKPTTRPWRRLRQAHFYYSQLSKKTSVEDLKNKYKGVDIERFIRMCEVHKIAASYDFGDIATNNKARNQRTFPVSTIERLYDDSKFREHLNFEFNKNGEINIKSGRKRFDEEFKKVILDAVDKNIDTRSLNTEENRKVYYSKLDKLKKSSKVTSSSKYTPKAPIKRKRSRTIGLFDHPLICTINSRGIERVFGELQTINYGKFPNAAHDLMRSFLEAVLKEYLKKKNHRVIPKRQGGYIFFDDVLREAENYFRKTTNHQIRQIVTTLIKEKEFFDCINHNPSIFSTEDKVKDAADQMSDLIKFIFEDK
jgi:hypothetical protein